MTHKERLEIIEAYLVEHPYISKYGYLLKLQDYLKKKYDIEASKSILSIDVKIIEKKWNETEQTKISKELILRKYLDMLESTETETIKIKILENLSKISGYDIQKIQTTVDGEVNHGISENLVNGLIERITNYTKEGGTDK